MNLKEKKGFTLTELMIVVVIIGVLTAVAVPVTLAVREKAENNACLQNQHIIHTEAVQYLADHGVYPDNVKQLVDEGYLQTMPHCKGNKYEDIEAGFAKCPYDPPHTEPIQ
jgi:prepilin-type N-terminal cleavage/methylation domain-containing protein